MGALVALQAEHAAPAGGEMAGGGAAHAPRPITMTS